MYVWQGKRFTLCTTVQSNIWPTLKGLGHKMSIFLKVWNDIEQVMEAWKGRFKRYALARSAQLRVLSTAAAGIQHLYLNNNHHSTHAYSMQGQSSRGPKPSLCAYLCVDGTLQHVHHPQLARWSVTPGHHKMILEDHQIRGLLVGPDIQNIVTTTKLKINGKNTSWKHSEECPRFPSFRHIWLHSSPSPPSACLKTRLYNLTKPYAGFRHPDWMAPEDISSNEECKISAWARDKMFHHQQGLFHSQN